MTIKASHEFRDPIHVFIRLDHDERRVVDAFEFQRLRHVHQLALSHLVYPGATHRRFEHCLGVMELAARVYNVVTEPRNLRSLPEPTQRELPRDEAAMTYWRRALRMGAMCHDLGHLPFSHAAEHELLPAGWDHERLSVAVIQSEPMRGIWKSMKPPLDPDDVTKIAVGLKARKYPETKDLTFSDWDLLLAEIVVGNAFGVDRMDYLLRDSHHAGVSYGRFDHYRLIDTLRILPKAVGSDEPTLGVEEGGIHAAEALLIARRSMFTQVYFHPVRRIYDIHLKDFLKEWLPGGVFPTTVPQHLAMTDNEVVAAMYKAAAAPGDRLHTLARRIICREHFKVVYQRTKADLEITQRAGDVIFQACVDRYGADAVRHDSGAKVEQAPEFPVLLADSRLLSSKQVSSTLELIQPIVVDSIFIDPKRRDDARDWLRHERENLLRAAPPGAEE
jgi:HD superfamily phosphohydrolase